MGKTLPKGWELKKLGEVCLINPPKPEILSENNVTFLPMDAISADGDIQHMETRQYKEVKNGYTGFVENDVLFAKITPCMENGKGTIAKGLLNSIGFGSTEFHVIRASEKILPEIIFRYLSLKNIRKIAEVNMVGSAGQKRVPQSFLNTLKIPLPPLPTQHKIVEILKEADSLRKLRQKADDKMKDLIPSLFVEMFGDPTTNPKGWEVKKLGEVANVKRGASPRPMGDPRYFGGNIPWVRIADIHRSGKFLKETEDHVTEEGARKSIYLKAGSLIMAMAASIGTPCFLAVDGCIHDGFVVFEDVSPNLDKEFLFYFIVAFKEQFANLAPEGTQKNLNTRIIKFVKIPLPPLPLQQEFAERVKEIEEEKERQAEGKKKLDELFNSLMQRAFKGELVA